MSYFCVYGLNFPWRTCPVRNPSFFILNHINPLSSFCVFLHSGLHSFFGINHVHWHQHAANLIIKHLPHGSSLHICPFKPTCLVTIVTGSLITQSPLWKCCWCLSGYVLNFTAKFELNVEKNWKTFEGSLKSWLFVHTFYKSCRIYFALRVKNMLGNVYWQLNYATDWQHHWI